MAKSSFRRIKRQYLSAFSANTVMLAHGCALGWFSPALPLLTSENTPLESGPFTTEHTSWSGSILSLGGIAGNILFGYMMVRVGTKHTIMSFAVPQAISWLFIYFGLAVEHIYISRFVSGFVGGGIQTVMLLYIAEIADNDIRGKLGTIHQFSRNFGVLIAYVFGAHIKYTELSIIYLAITTIFILSFWFLPSTPQYLLKHGQINEAESALRFYKGFSRDEKSGELNEEFARLQKLATENNEDNKFSFKDICEPAARKGLTIALILAFLNQMCGSYAFITYSSFIFEKSGTNLSTSTSSIVLALVQISGTFFTAQLIETQGRKPLLIFSLSGCIFGLSSMGIYLYCELHDYDVSYFGWVPVTSLAFDILIASIGIIPLTLICLVEVLPTKIRSFGLTVGTVAINCCSFIVVKFFPLLIQIIHLYGCMFVFAGSCFVGLLYIILFMEETKGKNLDQLKQETQTSLDSKA